MASVVECVGVTIYTFNILKHYKIHEQDKSDKYYTTRIQLHKLSVRVDCRDRSVKNGLVRKKALDSNNISLWGGGGACVWTQLSCSNAIVE